jgi:endoplasmic reticulum junction formation protein lunapark
LSPASFEKALSAASKKIQKANANLDGCRQRARRLKALWTLYAGFTYVLYLMIMSLVVGWKSWGPTEYTAVAAGPLA